MRDAQLARAPPFRLAVSTALRGLDTTGGPLALANIFCSRLRFHGAIPVRQPIPSIAGFIGSGSRQQVNGHNRRSQRIDHLEKLLEVIAARIGHQHDIVFPHLE